MFKILDEKTEQKEPTIGYVHSFETFGSVDGPGIRFITFMQGCILKCKYCHNRDTWKWNVGKKMTPEELVKYILRYKPYFDASGGGVTFSGGDPMVQQDFLIEIISILKEYNIHVAIDTSGAYDLTDKAKKVIELADLILLDIKHIDDEKAIDLTGVSNKQNLIFAKYLSDINKPVWIRQVIVPGYTDDEEDLKNLRVFLETLDNVENIELLPYHDAAKYKWEELGHEYPLEGVRVATDDDIKRVREIMNLKLDDNHHWVLNYN